MNACQVGDLVALGAAGAWLMGVEVLPLTVRALRAFPEPEQVRRVTALSDAANACRTDDLRGILTSGEQPA